METTELARNVPDSVLEVKRWLRGQQLNPKLATPMRWLFQSYRLQGGQRSASEFSHAILAHCPGLKVVQANNRRVVQGIAPLAKDPLS